MPVISELPSAGGVETQQTINIPAKNNEALLVISAYSIPIILCVASSLAPPQAQAKEFTYASTSQAICDRRATPPPPYTPEPGPDLVIPSIEIYDYNGDPLLPGEPVTIRITVRNEGNKNTGAGFQVHVEKYDPNGELTRGIDLSFASLEANREETIGWATNFLSADLTPLEGEYQVCATADSWEGAPPNSFGNIIELNEDNNSTCIEVCVGPCPTSHTYLPIIMRRHSLQPTPTPTPTVSPTPDLTPPPCRKPPC